MTHRLLLALCALPIASCGVPECGSAFASFSPTGGCTIKRAAACPEGEVRNTTGECQTAYNTTNSVPVDPPEETDAPIEDTDPPSETDDTEGEPIDTAIEVPYDCTYRISIFSGSYASEVGFGIATAGGAQLFGLTPGTLTTNSNTYTYNVELLPGSYNAVLSDSYADGWNGASYEIRHFDSNTLVVNGTLPSGGSATHPFTTTCTAN
jgi:hypothetical protein